MVKVVSEESLGRVHLPLLAWRRSIEPTVHSLISDSLHDSELGVYVDLTTFLLLNSRIHSVNSQSCKLTILNLCSN